MGSLIVDICYNVANPNISCHGKSGAGDMGTLCHLLNFSIKLRITIFNSMGK